MTGQINMDSRLGKLIYDLVSREDVKYIVEIGTWNGFGSTECIRKSIVENEKVNYEVYSLEINQKMYQEAIRRKFPENFHILLGRIIGEEDMNWMDWDEYFNSPDGYYFSMSKRSWYDEDIKNLRQTDNVLHLIPTQIDLLILDGGEFTTYPEFIKIGKRAKFIVLDDTKELKCKKIRDILMSDDEYRILEDEQEDRNGFLIAEKKIEI